MHRRNELLTTHLPVNRSLIGPAPPRRPAEPPASPAASPVKEARDMSDGAAAGGDDKAAGGDDKAAAGAVLGFVHFRWDQLPPAALVSRPS